MVSATSKALALLLAAIVSCVVPATAAADVDADADDKARGKALLAEGLDLMDHGHAQEALARFEAAYRIVPSPKVLFNMGLAHQALGNTVEALESFEGFLGELPDAPEDARTYAEHQVERLRAGLSFVEVSANAPGAEARIDEQPVGLLPLKKAAIVRPGAHVVSIRAHGTEIFRQPILAVAGKQTRVFAVAPSAPSAELPTSGRPWQKTAFWVAAGVAGIALAGGITEHVTYEMRSSDYRDLLAGGQCLVGSPERSHCESLRDDAASAKTWAWVGYSVAVVSAGAAVAFSLLEPAAGPSVEPARARFACAPSVAVVGFSCVGSF